MIGSNRYQVIGDTGTGGMGAVYLAHDNLQERQVALKMIISERIDQKATIHYEL